MATVIGLSTSTALGQSWNQLGNPISGEAENDRSGRAVELSGDGSKVIIGAYDNADNGPSTGHARVFEWSGTNWQQKGTDIDGAPATADGDQCGAAVSIDEDGSTIAVSSPRNDENGSNAGLVRVFQWNGSDWTQQGSAIKGDTAGDFLGASVSLSDDGQSIAVGSPYFGPYTSTNYSYGLVKVFYWNGSDWELRGTPIRGDFYADQAHIVSLSASGLHVAIGAKYSSYAGHWSGQVRVFQWSGSEWQQVGLSIYGEAADDESGSDVSISDDGSTVAIGAPRNDDNGNLSGQVRVYHWDGSAWVLRGGDIDGAGISDSFGASVSLSGDGNTLAVGAPEDGYGSVWIYQWDGSQWQMAGAQIAGVSQGEKAGTAVGLSSDGTRVAFGAPYNDDPSSDIGQVRVYEFEPMGVSEAQVPSLLLFPNPTSFVSTLILQNATARSVVQVYDLAGNLTNSVTIERTGQSVQINVADVPAGIYMVRLADGRHVSVWKLIVTH